jgi:hypothetical protein
MLPWLAGPPSDSLIFIESVMDPYDAHPAAVNSGNSLSDLDYGPAGRSTALICRSGQPYNGGA